MRLKHLKYACTKSRWNNGDRRLQHTCTTIATYATSQSTFEISAWNNWNIHLKHLKTLEKAIANICNIQIYFCNMQMKHLQHMYETSETLENIRLQQACYATSTISRWNTWDIRLKHLQYTCRKNRWNIGDRLLHHMYTTIATYATSRSTFATSAWNNRNIHLEQLKHLKHELATCLKKRLETLETQHRRAGMTYLVGNCGGVGSLDGDRLHAPAMPTVRPRERRRWI